jgi:hypothetical protein
MYTYIHICMYVCMYVCVEYIHLYSDIIHFRPFKAIHTERTNVHSLAYFIHANI